MSGNSLQWSFDLSPLSKKASAMGVQFRRNGNRNATCFEKKLVPVEPKDRTVGPHVTFGLDNLHVMVDRQTELIRLGSGLLIYYSNKTHFY